MTSRLAQLEAFVLLAKKMIYTKPDNVLTMKEWIEECQGCGLGHTKSWKRFIEALDKL